MGLTNIYLRTKEGIRVILILTWPTFVLTVAYLIANDVVSIVKAVLMSTVYMSWI